MFHRCYVPQIMMKVSQASSEEEMSTHNRDSTSEVEEFHWSIGDISVYYELTVIFWVRIFPVNEGKMWTRITPNTDTFYPVQ